MAKRRNKQDTQLQIHLVVVIGSLIIMLLLGVFLGVYIWPEYFQEKSDVPGISETPAPTTKIETKQYTEPVREFVRTDKESTFATIGVPAVDEQGNGVVTSLDVQVSPGTGKILTNIDKLFFWVDTQNSIRIATKVAEEVTKKDASLYDIVYAVRANASVIEGGSAGAALTIATIAALENKTLNRSVMITGTIAEDGKVGPVGEIFAKAVAAKDMGAALFLVPEGQGSTRVYKPQRDCYKEGIVQICETKTTSEKVFISKDVGIEVREVKTVQAAIKYFLVE